MVGLWQYRMDRYSYLIEHPILCVYAITTIVEKYVKEMAELVFNTSLACHKALLLWWIMSFLLTPSQKNFKKITNIYTAKENSHKSSFQLPSHLEPEYILDVVIWCEWGMKGNFFYVRRISMMLMIQIHVTVNHVHVLYHNFPSGCSSIGSRQNQRSQTPLHSSSCLRQE